MKQDKDPILEIFLPYICSSKLHHGIFWHKGLERRDH
jgi:hypothetical protein